MYELFEHSTLQSVKITGNIYDSQAKINVEQVYMSFNPNPLEVKYQFSLDPNAHIVAVSAEIGDNTYDGQIKPRAESKREYDTAILEKFTVLRLTKQNYGDDFKLELGNIAPKTKVTIRYTYITVVPAIADTFTYVFPTNIAPRYTPTKGLVDSEPRGLTAIVNGDYDSLKYTTKTTYYFEFDVTVQTSGRLEAVDSNLMRSATRVSENSYRMRATTTPSDGTMVVTYKSDVKPCMYTNDNKYCYIRYDFPLEDAKDTRPKKYSILVDRSGSMSGQKMSDCLNALEFTVNSLPPGSQFNIISFGSNYTFMWPEHREYTNDTKAEALGKIRKFTADMGGTELYDCLGQVLKNTGAPPEQHKGNQTLKWLSDRILPSTTNGQSPAPAAEVPEHIVILMTDGQISGSANINKMISSAVNTRICALGIGKDANRNQLVELANCGRGFCYMASDSKDITTLIVTMIANCCMYKYFQNVRINDKQVAKFGYPNTINTMYYKRSTHDEELILTYEDSDLPGVTLSNTIDMSVVAGDNTITQLYYANMEPENEAAHLEHTILSNHNSFFLKSVEKITATGPLTQETIAHHSDVAVDGNYAIANGILDSLTTQCAVVSKSRGKYSASASYPPSVQQVMGIMYGHVDSVLERGEAISPVDDLRSTIHTLKSMGTPCGAELEDQNEMLDDIGFEVRAAQGLQPRGFGQRVASSFKSMLGISTTSSKMSNASRQVSTLTTQTMPQSVLPATPARILDVAPVALPTNIMSYRMTNGSFRYSEELLNILGYTVAEFQKYIVNNNLSEEKAINQLVLEYLVRTKDSKYSLVIGGIRQYLRNLTP